MKSKLKIILWLITLTFSSPKQAFSNEFNAQKRKQIIKGLSYKIFENKNIIPSGNWGNFNGKQRRFLAVNDLKPLNQADKDFGLFLYSIYDTYCLKKFGQANCLGKKLKVQYSLLGTARLHAKKIVLKINGKRFNSHRFQQTTIQFLNYLSKSFGSPGFTKEERQVLYPKYKNGIRLNFHVVLPKMGFGGNNKWQHEDFLSNLLNYINKEFQMGNNPFILNSIKTYRNGPLFNHKNLTDVWWEFVDEGEEGLKKYNYKSTQRKREVSIIVAGPGKLNSNGSYEQGNTTIGRYSRPSVAIRNSSNPLFESLPWTDSDLFREYADIILHEIGHNTLALEHGPTDPGSKLNANNILFNKREFANKLKNHFKHIGGFKKSPLWEY